MTRLMLDMRKPYQTQQTWPAHEDEVNDEADIGGRTALEYRAICGSPASAIMVPTTVMKISAKDIISI